MKTDRLDRRLKELEEKNTLRILTLGDYVLWRAKGCPNRENVEFSPQMLEFRENMIACYKARHPDVEVED